MALTSKNKKGGNVMIFFYASVGVVVLGGAFYAGKHWSLPWLKRKCTATTKGYYVFYEKDSRVQVENT